MRPPGNFEAGGYSEEVTVHGDTDRVNPSREIRTAAARTVVQLACKRKDDLTSNTE